MGFNDPLDSNLDSSSVPEERRRILALPTEPNPVRLWRVLGSTVMILWSTRATDPRATLYFDLEESFGNDYHPRDGFRLALKRGERVLQLKIDWNMVWVMKNVLYVRTELHRDLIEVCEGGPLEELVVKARATAKSSRPKTFRVTKAKHESSF